MKILLSLATVILLSGCVVPTTYTKTVTVRRDADGKIVETIETEGVVQQGQDGYPVKFQHLDGIQPKPYSGAPASQGKAGAQQPKSIR
jgi:hypothetical protein